MIEALLAVYASGALFIAVALGALVLPGGTTADAPPLWEIAAAVLAVALLWPLLVLSLIRR